ncbi:MAG TPA: SLC13 family permease, partial [bacterium]|nr:SLC13 family permease [bacterium]
GLADQVGHVVHRTFGGQEVLVIAAIMTVSGALSSVMNNVAATVVLLPAVSSISRLTRLPPSRLFMPLSFGAVLGGTTTLVGTPPNILAGDALAATGLAGFGFFDFTPIGVSILLLGILWMMLGGRRLLPVRANPQSVSRTGDLVQVYRLHEQLFSLRVPTRSRLAGRTIAQTAFRRTLGVEIVGVQRAGRTIVAPSDDLVLDEGDTLLLKGSAEAVRDLYRVRGTELAEAQPEDLDLASRRIGGMVARLRADSTLAGRTLRELDFRKRYGAIVTAIRSGDELRTRDLAAHTLSPGDQILALGPRSRVDEEELLEDFDISSMGPQDFRELHGHVYVLRVPDESGLAGVTLGETRQGAMAGLAITGVLRGDRSLLGLDPDERILPGDRLLVTGQPSRLRELQAFGHVELQQDIAEDFFETDGVGVVEATVAPRSEAAGRTLSQISFRQRTGLQVLALWRDGSLLHDRLTELPLRFGDALLLQGPWERVRHLASDPDWVVLSSAAQQPRRTAKAPLALAGLGLMVALVATGWQPVHVAAFAAATFVLLFRVITPQEAYRAVSWRAVFLVACILPIGSAVQRSGGAELISGMILDVAGASGPWAVLAALVIASGILSQTLDGSPTVVLLAPICFTVAQELGVSPRPLLMGIGLAASSGFGTPFAHKAHLLVMGAGGYR